MNPIATVPLLAHDRFVVADELKVRVGDDDPLCIIEVADEFKEAFYSLVETNVPAKTAEFFPKEHGVTGTIALVHVFDLLLAQGRGGSNGPLNVDGKVSACAITGFPEWTVHLKYIRNLAHQGGGWCLNAVRNLTVMEVFRCR